MIEKLLKDLNLCYQQGLTPKWDNGKALAYRDAIIALQAESGTIVDVKKLMADYESMDEFDPGHPIFQMAQENDLLRAQVKQLQSVEISGGGEPVESVDSNPPAFYYEALANNPVLYRWEEINIDDWHLFTPLWAAQPSPNKADVQDNPILTFIEVAHDLIDEHPYLYVEIARTRTTDWMTWLRKKPDGELIASGQGPTAAEACQSALDSLPPLKDDKQ